MFQFDTAEKAGVVTNCGHLSKLKFSRSQPFAFTEFGAAISLVLRPREGERYRLCPPSLERALLFIE